MITSTDKILKRLLAVVAVFYIALFVYVALSRIGYPFELEWMEGGSVEHVDRIMQGKEIYTPPSIEFIPYIYTPLYYYVSIPLAETLGVSLLPLRIVSLASTLALFFVIFLFVKKETASWYFGLIAAGLFAATYRIGGAWFDLARVDMLHLLLLMIAFYLLRFNKTPLAYVIAAVVAGLSFLTKQTAAMIFLPVGIYLLIKERKISWYFNIIFALIVIATTSYYTSTTDGWYYFWNFVLPADHRWTKKVFILFWTYDLIRPFSIAILLTLAFMGYLKKRDGERFWFYFSFFVGVIFTSWFARLHYGGYANVLIPVYLLLSVVAVLGLKEVLDHADDFNKKAAVVVILNLSILFQFIALLYSPRNQIPTKADEQAGWELVEKLKSFDGDCYIFSNIYLARLAGKKVYTHGMLIFDLMQSNTKYNKFIEKEFEDALKSHKFDVILDYAQMDIAFLLKYYKIKEPAFKDKKVFLMRTGFTTRPEHILVPKK